MKLIDDFYKIVLLEKNDDSFSCKVSLNANHGLYRVHFPGNPVTPGVCLIQMASEKDLPEYVAVLVSALPRSGRKGRMVL